MFLSRQQRDNYFFIFSYQIFPNESDGAAESERQNNTLASKIHEVEVLSGNANDLEKGIELHSVQIHSDQTIVRYAIFT